MELDDNINMHQTITMGLSQCIYCTVAVTYMKTWKLAFNHHEFSPITCVSLVQRLFGVEKRYVEYWNTTFLKLSKQNKKKLGLRWATLNLSWDWILVLFSVDLFSLDLV